AGRSGTRSPVSTGPPGVPPGKPSSAGRPRDLVGCGLDAVSPRSATEPQSGVAARDPSPGFAASARVGRSGSVPALGLPAPFLVVASPSAVAGPCTHAGV